MVEREMTEQMTAMTDRFDEAMRYNEATGFAKVPKGARQAPDECYPTPPATAMATPSNPYVAPLAIVCEHANFGGAQWISSNGWSYVGDWWNDRISSIIIVSGRWRFFEASDGRGASWELGPGYYPNLAAANIPNDIISSFWPVAW